MSQDAFGPQTQAHGVFSRPGQEPRVGVRLGDAVLDVAAAARRAGLDLADALAEPALNAFMALGPGAWAEERAWLDDLLPRLLEPQDGVRPRADGHGAVPHDLLVPSGDVTLHLPFVVADYVDFYASRHHAANLGAMFRPGQPALTPNWTHLPIGYHGRAGTVVVTGTDVRRPVGQVRPPGSETPEVVPSRRLDIEAEVGFVVGAGSALGEPVAVHAFADHVFGVCLVNDWSARDLQAWEYVPLGPVPRQVLRHERVGLGDAAVVARGGTPAGPAARAPGAGLPRRLAPPVGPGPPAGRRAQRPPRVVAAVRRHVLDSRAAAGAPDRQRGVAADG